MLIERDDENPDLYYAVTSGQTLNTLAKGYPDGMRYDRILPIQIDDGQVGQRIYSPMLNRYNLGKIDEIWAWKKK